MLEASFRLKDAFVAKYKGIKPPFGFNGLGELVYMRTYSRIKEDGSNEQWFETVRRVVEGTYRMQERHILANDLGWNEARAHKSAQEMYDRIFNMKFLPPGRGLWAMGSSMTEDRGLFAALNNCAFVSTEDVDRKLEKAFTFLMDASMLGVGVGFDTKGAGKIILCEPAAPQVFIVPDTREGWVLLLAKTVRAYFCGEALPIPDYSLVRVAGTLIKGFGGVASGPEPLKALVDEINRILSAGVGQPLSVTMIVDIMNLIGKCVVAGNVRRTAEIAFGEYDSEEYLDLKNYSVNPHRAEYGWTSNNSIFAKVGMDYKPSAVRVAMNGEPGYAWLDNMQKYSRMNGVVDNKDIRVRGGNPCLEQSLESMELCCLVETFPANHDSLEDYLRTLKFAYLYAKTVTLGKTHWPETNRVMLRNRRIGCSMSGVQQYLAKEGIENFRVLCEEGYKTIERYDRQYSEWFAIPPSVKKTSIKPSGTVSLLAGATPGMHWPESRTYIRRMRLSIYSDLVQPLRDAGYVLEPAFGSEESTLVVSIPVKIDENVRTVAEVSMWEQLSMAAFLQRYWADNQVSSTITFNPGLSDKEEAEFSSLRLLRDGKVKAPSLTHGEIGEYAALYDALDSGNATEEQTERYNELSRLIDASDEPDKFGLNDAQRMLELTEKAAKDESRDIASALDYMQYQLKGISFLPRLDYGAYPQMPYEAISPMEYERMNSVLTAVNFDKVGAEEADVEKFCDSSGCQIKLNLPAK